MNSHEVFIHIHQSCFACTGAIVRLPQCQWSKPDGYGKISQCITTTKHSKAKTVCIFLGIYCRGVWANSGFCHCYHSDAFWVGWIWGPIPGSAIAIIQMNYGLPGFYFLWHCAVYDVCCAVGKTHNSLEVLYCFMHATPSYSYHHADLHTCIEHILWKILGSA